MFVDDSVHREWDAKCKGNLLDRKKKNGIYGHQCSNNTSWALSLKKVWKSRY